MLWALGKCIGAGYSKSPLASGGQCWPELRLQARPHPWPHTLDLTAETTTASPRLPLVSLLAARNVTFPAFTTKGFCLFYSYLLSPLRFGGS